MTILDQLADYARERVELSKKNVSFDEVRSRALEMAAASRQYVPA